MRLWIGRLLVFGLLLAGVSVFALQSGGRGRTSSGDDDPTLPNGKSQKDEIAKAEHRQNIKDAADLADLADELKVELEKNDRYVISMSAIKKTDDIEKLAKRIRSRLRHN